MPLEASRGVAASRYIFFQATELLFIYECFHPCSTKAQISSHIIAQECYKDMKQVLDEYKAVISRLAFTNTGKEMFLLEPENNLPNLTKLVLQHLENNSGAFTQS